jgi:hypothetical protein
VSDPSKLLLECFKRIDALAALSLHVGDAADATRLEWLLHHLSGKELRDIGIEVSAGGLDAGRIAIDAAMGASALPTALSAPALRASAPIAGAGGESDRWIPVTERLPEMDVPVWLAEAGDIYVGGRSDSGDGWLWCNCYCSHYFTDKGWACGDMEMDDDYQPTHWMPLPEPPDAQAIVTREGQDPQGLGGEAIERGPAGMRPGEIAQPSPHIEPVAGNEWRIPVELPDGRIAKMRYCDLKADDLVAFIDSETLPPFAASPTIPTEGPAQTWYLCSDVEIPQPDGDSQLSWFLWVREGAAQGNNRIQEVLHFDALWRHWSLRNLLGNATVSGAENRHEVRAMPRYWRDPPALPDTEAVRRVLADARENDPSKSAGTLTDPEGAS